MPLEIRESIESEILVLALVGRLDTKTSGALEKSIATHLGTGQRRFVLDLSEMEYVSSAGLRIFLMLAKKASGGSGSLSLCGLSPQVKEVFDIAGFTRLFTLAATRAEALAGGGKAPEARAPKKQDARSEARPAVEPAAEPVKKTPEPAPAPSPKDLLAARAAAVLGASAAESAAVSTATQDRASRAASVLVPS